nr:hypothetical protein [Bradyrhizobium diazoefficiens]
MAIAVTIRRMRSNPIDCRVPEGCDGQLMTTNPESKWRSAKMQHELRHVWRFVLKCHGGSTACRAMFEAIAVDCGSAATVGKLRIAASGPDLKFARGLLTRDFHVAILPTIGCGGSAVRFATLRLEQTSGSPFVAWHAK